MSTTTDALAEALRELLQAVSSLHYTPVAANVFMAFVGALKKSEDALAQHDAAKKEPEEVIDALDLLCAAEAVCQNPSLANIEDLTRARDRAYAARAAQGEKGGL